MASRTLLINPEDDQKKAYNIAFEAIDVLVKNLVVGKPIKNAYNVAKSFIKDKDEKLANKVHTNFGFGVRSLSFIVKIGCNIKEDILMINETNESFVSGNMSFHVRITLTDVNPSPKRSNIALGETIIIDEEGRPNILTSHIQRKYNEISYSLDVSGENV